MGNVVLNRVASKQFPNTIYDVIFDTKYAVQFEPTANGTVYNTPSKDSISAAKRVLAGRTSLEMLYISITHPWWMRSGFEQTARTSKPSAAMTFSYKCKELSRTGQLLAFNIRLSESFRNGQG